MKVEVSAAFHTPQAAFWLLAFGAGLTILGLLHRLPAISRWDARTFQSLHANLRRSADFFRYLWPLGTTPVGIVLILIIYIAGRQTGVVVTGVYILAAMLERAIKMRIQRPRPFTELPDVQMRQPNPPRDPSHPSGDSLRVWFLAIVFPWAFALPWPVTLLTCAIAGILSLGRIALGVHYPLDVLGGVGLGLFAAGATLIGYPLAFLN